MQWRQHVAAQVVATQTVAAEAAYVHSSAACVLDVVSVVENTASPLGRASRRALADLP